MKRKVALLSVLLPRVPLLILDEPTNTLDPTMRDELFAPFCARRAIEAKRCCFPRTSWPRSEQVCDRVGILQHGKLVHLQSIAELNAEEAADPRSFPPPPEDWPDLPGLEVLRQDGRESSTCRSAVRSARLLDWLGRAAGSRPARRTAGIGRRLCPLPRSRRMTILALIRQTAPRRAVAAARDHVADWPGFNACGCKVSQRTVTEISPVFSTLAARAGTNQKGDRKRDLRRARQNRPDNARRRKRSLRTGDGRALDRLRPPA